MKAVDELRTHEKEVVTSRIEVANLLSQASKAERITDLAELTGIGRTTIYWLIKVWSNDKNDENRNP